jgi:hypothetical protein
MLVVRTILALALAAPPPTGAPAATSEPAAPARAGDPGKSLAVLPIALTGAADETLRQPLVGHLQQGLARGAFSMIDPAEVARHAGDPCDSACVARVHAATRAGFVLRPSVRVDDRDYVVRLELYAGADGALLAESEERCDLCGFAEVGALVEAQGALLRRKLENLIQGPPRLRVTTDPPGALVLVDDALVGRTPVDRTLLEGDHRVRVLLDGYVGDERRVKLEAGVQETLAIPLRREPRLTRYRQVGTAGLAIGAPLLAAGIGLLAIDGKPYRGRCEGRDRDAMGNCAFVFDTDWGGAIGLAAGAALLAAGTVLLLRTRDRPRPGRRAHVLPAGLGVVGRF